MMSRRSERSWIRVSYWAIAAAIVATAVAGCAFAQTSAATVNAKERVTICAFPSIREPFSKYMPEGGKV